MNFRLLDGIVAGLLISRVFELVPQIMFPTDTESWWGAAIGGFLQAICAAGLLKFGKYFTVPTLALTLLATILMIHMLVTVEDSAGLIARLYIPLVLFYATTSVLLLATLPRLYRKSAEQGAAANP